VGHPALLGVVRGARHPAAARLLIAFLMGDESDDGGAGYAPFRVPGDYPTRTDLAPVPGTLTLDELNAWRMDPARTLASRQRVAELLLAARGS